jgi:hypothetical protein
VTKFAGGGENVRRKLFERDGPNCWICSFPFTDADPATIDHVRTKREGGTDGLYNLRLAHLSCNGARGQTQDPKVDGRTGFPYPMRPFGKDVLVFGCPWPECDWQYWCGQASHAMRARKAYHNHYPSHLQERLFDAGPATEQEEADDRPSSASVPHPT